MLKIAVLISGNGTNLQALIDAEKTGNLSSGSIGLVIADREGAYGLLRAEANRIPTLRIDRKQYPSQREFDLAIKNALHLYGIHLIVLAGFLSILGPDLVNDFDRRILNVHPSLLPAFSGPGFYGLRVHEAALQRGVKVTGATVHYVNEVTDGGEILLQKAVEVLPTDTPLQLQKRVMEEAEWVLLPRAVEQVLQTLMEKGC